MNSFSARVSFLPLYLIACFIVIAVLIQAFLFLSKAWKHGRDISLDACSDAIDFYEYFIEHYPS